MTVVALCCRRCKQLILDTLDSRLAPLFFEIYVQNLSRALSKAIQRRMWNAQSALGMCGNYEPRPSVFVKRTVANNRIHQDDDDDFAR